MNRNSKSASKPSDPRAIAHDQLRDSHDGVMREGKSDKGMRQPHERDEAPDGGKKGTDPRTDIPQVEISRAHADVEKGLVDTDRRGVPSNVPSRAKNRAP